MACIISESLEQQAIFNLLKNAHLLLGDSIKLNKPIFLR